MHTDLKPYKSDVCEKTLARKDNLITHKRTHAGERPDIYVIYIISLSLIVGT